MTTNISVNCSGALFSSLQFQLINHKKIQEGFLLGHVEKFTSHSISDSEIDKENMNIVINLTGYIPCTAMGTFYSGSGKVNFKHLKEIMQHNLERVVGWYHSRRMSEAVFLKEMRIHEQLREGMPHTDGHFLFALFSRLQPAECGTMDVNYKFQIMLNNNEFEGVPLRIVNMSDTSTSQYIRTAPCSALYSSRSLQSILESLENIEPGIKEAEQLHNGLLNQLRSLLPKHASVQEQHHKVLQVVNKLQEFCHRAEIKLEPDEAKEECEFDLMDLESPSPKLKKKGQPNSSLKGAANVSKNVGTSDAKKPDLFGFVEEEMEKHQENDVTTKKGSKVRKEASGSVNSKSENEKANNPKMKLKTKVTRKNSGDEEAARVLRNSSATAKTTHSPSSSPGRKNSKEGVGLKNNNSTKMKPVRGTKLNSLEEKSLPNARHRSPSSGSKTQPKLKEKEAWTDNKMVTNSPEY